MNKYMGYFYAILAAMLNGFIGIFSVKVIQIGLPAYAVSFYKCLLGFILITSLLVCTNQFAKWITSLKHNWKKVSLCAFFGFFIVYFFETTAYTHVSVPVVVFLLLGSATITTFILKAVLNKRFLRIREIFNCSFAIVGLLLILDARDIYSYGIIWVMCAIIAGIGYGFFLTCSSRLKLGSGLIVVNSLMLFGWLYLSIPFVIQGIKAIPNLISFAFLIALAIFPTIGGFWCTTKALSILSGESVQLLELTEPIFSLVFAWIFLLQELNYIQLFGGACVIIAIYINIFLSR